MPGKLTSREREKLGEELYALRSAALALARRVLGENAAAEDACAESYLRALKHIEDLPSLQDLRTWFLRVVVNTARSLGAGEAARRRREEKAVQERPVSDLTPQGSAEHREASRVVSEELRGIDEKQRLALSLHYEAGLSHAETAAVLELPVGTASSNISRGLEELRRRLAVRGFSVAPAALLGSTGLAPVPEALSTAIRGVIAGKLGIKAATLGSAAVAGGIALIWKIVAGLAAVLLLGAGGIGAWKLLPGAPQAAAPEKPAARPEPTSSLDKVVTLKSGYQYPGVLLDSIAKQTRLRFEVQRTRATTLGRVNPDSEKTSVRRALEGISRQTGWSWKEVSPGKVVLFIQDPAFARRLQALKAVAGKDEVTRAEALANLCAGEDLRALPHLVRAVEDRSLLVRCWAVKLLADHMVDPFGRWRLSVFTHWLSPDQKKALVTALLDPKLFPEDAKPEAGSRGFSWLTLRLQLLGCLDEEARARAAVLGALNSAEKSRICAGIIAAGASGNEVYLDRLIDISKGKDRTQCLMTASRLARFENARAQEAWLEVQINKVRGRGQISGRLSGRDMWAVPRLLGMLEKGNPGQRAEAASALGKFGGTKEAVRIAKKLSELYMADPTARCAGDLVRSLADLGEPAGTKALCHALANARNEYELSRILGAFTRRWPIRDEKVETALLRLARKHWQKVIDENKWPEGSSMLRKAAKALGTAGGERSVRFLRELLLRAPEPKGDVYWYHPIHGSIISLRRIGGEQARLALEKVAKDARSASIARRAAFARLDFLPPKEAAAGLLKLAEESAPDDPELKGRWHVKYPLREATTSLTYKQPSSELAAALRTMAVHARPAVRVAAADAMGRFPGESFRKELFGLLEDGVPEVATVAGQAVTRRFLRSAGKDRDAVLHGMLSSAKPGARTMALAAMKNVAGFTCFPAFHDELVKQSKIPGSDGNLAGEILLSMATPRAVSWRIEQLKSGDASRRRRAVRFLRSHLAAHDPRVLPALKAHLARHPEDGKPVRGPRPKPKPKPAPPEVF